jgi:hypothetical protein
MFAALLIVVVVAGLMVRWQRGQALAAANRGPWMPMASPWRAVTVRVTMRRILAPRPVAYR